jgi:protein-S-isoprenylcysteine O-methyltransferase Ste14
VLVSLLLLVGLPFISYGSLRWTAGWVFVGITFAAKWFFGYYLKIRDPELVRRRKKIQQGTKGWDRVWLVIYMLTFLSILAIAGLDAGRYRWSVIPLPGMLIGGLSYIAAMLLTFWAMTVNTHFEGTVRIQTDRDHKVIETGPYRFVRHPGYIFLILTTMSIPALLGSQVAFLPAVVTAVLFIIRTALEDRTLQNELPGYVDYTKVVRYRLVPRLW